MTPPQAHINFDELFSACIFPISTCGLPGAHGAGVTGTQGMGVKTPKAAAVADATVGLAMELHIPKGSMLTIGAKSIIVAAGAVAITRFTGSTVNVDGAAPKLHCKLAPLHTRTPIDKSLP